MSTDHTQRAHALLSASGASRWLACPPSARLEDKYNQTRREKSSPYAEEGTLAHELADISLRLYNGEITKRAHTAELKKIKKSKYFSDEMVTEVQKYTDLVVEAFEAEKQQTPDAKLLIEQRVDFSHLAPDGFGTNDVIIVGNSILYVIDLKYGKGLEVSAEDNPQLKLYGSGALEEHDLFYGIEKIKLVIIQPRINNYSEWETTSAELRKWGQTIVKPRAELAAAGKGVQKAGSHCKFCKVSGMCATLAAKNVALAKHEFKDPHYLTDEQLFQVYKQTPMLLDWAKAVSKHILEEAMLGKQWPGLKVVEGKTQRKWASEAEVIKKLEEGFEDIKREDFITEKLKGIPAIEKLVGREKFKEVLGSSVDKPIGAPTLAPLSDRRPALGPEQAMEDFKDV